MRRAGNIEGRDWKRSRSLIMRRTLIVLGVLGILGVLGTGWWQISLSAANPTDTTLRSFIIAKGDGVREISRGLRNQGLVRDQVAFFLLIKKLGIEKNIQAGSFRLSPSMPAEEMAQKLTVGTEDIWITIPEGWRSEEILEYLQGQKIDDERWTIDAEVRRWKMEEGKYFPETYLIPKQMTIEEIRQLMRRTFEEKFEGKLRADANASGLTGEEVVILASLVEREAKLEADRPLVASVLLNRLRAGMKLDVDATVQYALGESGNWWPKDLSLEDLKIRSSYNTYLNAGLPPGPIANPGILAIKAVIYPSSTDYLFYISDKKGVMHYAKTLAEHAQNVAKYLE